MTPLKWTTLLLALGAGAAAGLADEGGSEHYANDVAVKLSLAHRRSPSPLAKVRVKNRGRQDQAGILVELRAESVDGEVLSSFTVDLRSRRTWSARVRVTPPEGTTVLVATTSLSGVADEHPGDDVAFAHLRPAGSSGGPSPAGPSAGAALYAANCASCHGTSAQGTATGPAIAGEDAEEIAEAIREGEDGMPTFPGLSGTDVRALAAWLKDPVPYVPPPPPPPPPPGTAPTYAGHVKALLDANCGACHSGKNAALNLRFDTYTTASNNAAAGLAAVQAGRMPKAGPLTAAEVQLLADWVAGGRKP